MLNADHRLYVDQSGIARKCEMADTTSLREKLRARRKAVEVSLQSEKNADSDVEDNQNLVEELEMLETEEDGSQLQSVLESRREISRRKLELEEQAETPVVVSA